MAIYFYGERVRITFDTTNIDIEGIVTEARSDSQYDELELVSVIEDNHVIKTFAMFDGRPVAWFGLGSIVPLKKVAIVPLKQVDLRKLWKRRVVVTFNPPRPPRLVRKLRERGVAGAEAPWGVDPLLQPGRVEGVVCQLHLGDNFVRVCVQTKECSLVQINSDDNRSNGVPVLGGFRVSIFTQLGDHIPVTSFRFRVIEERVLLLMDKKFGHLVCRDALEGVMAFLC